MADAPDEPPGESPEGPPDEPREGTDGDDEAPEGAAGSTADTGADRAADATAGGAAAAGEDTADVTADAAEDDQDLETLRERVEAEYDFDDFGPSDMARMSAAEWEAAFDPDSWVVGEALLDRVQEDLERRIAERDVFAVVERVDGDAIEGERDGGTRVLAYSDEGYAVVYPDGSVEGRGTVLRDVKPTVALCSMESYDVAPAPEGAVLPSPAEVPEGSGEFGNLMLQVVAAGQVLAGLALLAAWLLAGLTIIAAAVALLFLGVGAFLFLVVANARLSDRFRARQFRERLRAAGVEEGRRPEFLPLTDAARADEAGAAGEGAASPAGERSAPADDRTASTADREATDTRTDDA